MADVRRRRGHSSTAAALPSRRVSAAEQQTRQRRLANARIIRLASIGSSFMLLVHFYLIDEYAWVRRRCIKSSMLLGRDTVAAVECVEARTHQLAEQDFSLSDRGIPRDIQFMATPVQHVHFTVTTPLVNHVLSLALCSMETCSGYCKGEGCVVHVWIVDQAATAIRTNKTNKWFDEMQRTLQHSKHCLHISTGSSMDVTQRTSGSGCSEPVCSSGSRELKEWLASPLASEQLPAHVSDAWRLVALAEYGGLYLDADVLPLSPKLLYLPRPAVPVQSKVGAYRLNGGVLISEPLQCDNEAKKALRLTKLSFLKAMIRDHLQWAPRLARLSRPQQTFGFLGPCALTRIYTSRTYDDAVTILGNDKVEGVVSEAALCHDDRRLTVHFSGTRKNNWVSAVSRHACMRSRVHECCPLLVETHELFT